MPAPGGLGVSLTGGTFTAMWSVVSGASRYELQDRTDGPGGEWTRVGTTTSATLAYSPAGGPECDTTYDFRVRSYGDAATYAAGWSVESGLESVTTESCNRAPEFATSTYSFMVAEDAAATDTVGTVSAIDPDSDPVSYAITGGNASGKFEMSTSTGAITVAGALDHETAPMYTLTVEARDDGDGVGTATVEIAVTDVPEDTPPAPGGLGVSLTNDMFTVTCSTVTRRTMRALRSTSCSSRCPVRAQAGRWLRRRRGCRRRTVPPAGPNAARRTSSGCAPSHGPHPLFQPQGRSASVDSG